VIRILVTGSRGKSSVVRLLHAAFTECGLDTRARITGVVPRELGPEGERIIERSAGAHVEEMRWWLRTLPDAIDAVVLENSAIAPELQELAGRWLRPDLTLLSSVVPDHQEAWGDGPAAAVQALAGGVPHGGRVVLPGSLSQNQQLLGLLAQRGCRLRLAAPLEGEAPDHRAVNLGLAMAACGQLGLDESASREAMRRLPPDRYDFRLSSLAGAEWALAFSTNDIESTRAQFESLDWPENRTRLIYNHRRDRPLRLESFSGWLGERPWREVLIIGDRPAFRPSSARYRSIRTARDLLALGRPGEQLFGCGNVAGLPLTLYDEEAIS
jgi:hypothetical protein